MQSTDFMKKGTLETIRRVDNALLGPIYCSYNVQRYGYITRVCWNPVLEENIVYTDRLYCGATC